MEITQKIVALKLPEKFQFTGGVVGNGNVLGFTNGTMDTGLQYTSSNFIGFTGGGDIGKPVGSSFKSAGFNTATSCGLSTTPDKTGVVLHTNETPTFIAY